MLQRRRRYSVNPAWLDAEGNPIAPDLIVRPDVAPDTANQGLLSSLSEADLEETNLFVYRVLNPNVPPGRLEKKLLVDFNCNSRNVCQVHSVTDQRLTRPRTGLVVQLRYLLNHQ
jgi:hypothetical protein